MIVAFLRTCFFFFFIVLSTVITGIGAVVVRRLTKSSDKSHIIGRLWGLLNLWAAGVSVEIRGLENIDPHGTYIYAANHQGWFDIFALLAKLPVQFRWLAKQELFILPFLGQAMTANGYIPIDRRDKRKAFMSMKEAAARVNGGTSVVVFPEGTRSPDGVLRDFKKGVFLIATWSHKPVVPITISGSHLILRKGSRMIHPGVVRITVEAPIPTEGYTSANTAELIEKVREAIRMNLSPAEGGPNVR